MNKKFEYLEKFYAENNELSKLLTSMKDEPIILANNHRLLSVDEVVHYKEELNISADIIPLIDLSDNDFLVYDISKGKFTLFNIVDELSFKEVDNIQSYIDEMDLI